MIDLSRKIADVPARVSRAKEAHKLIKREKGLIYQHKLILVADFLEAAVLPAIESSPLFEQNFGAGGLRISMYLNVNHFWGRASRRDLEYLDLKEVSKVNIANNSRRRFERYLAELRELELRVGVERMGLTQEEAEATRPSPAELRAYTDKFVADNCAEESEHPAFYIKDIKAAMDDCGNGMVLFNQGIKQYELSSLMRDQGDRAAAFWKAVKNLPDYSGLDPDKGPPKGDKPDKGNSGDAKWWGYPAPGAVLT